LFNEYERKEEQECRKANEKVKGQVMYMKRTVLFAVITLVLAVAGLLWERTGQQKVISGNIEYTGITLDKIFRIKEGMSYREVKEAFNKEGDLMSTKGRKGSVHYVEIYKWKGIKPETFIQVTFQDGKAVSMKLSK
jgi:hypothetical protein